MSPNNLSDSISTSDKLRNNVVEKTTTTAEKKQEILTQTQVDLQNLIVENRISFYGDVIRSISLRLRQVNAENEKMTSVVAGIGDFIGEKTGLYESGNAIFTRGNFEPILRYAKEAQTQILLDFEGKNLSPSQNIAISYFLEYLQNISNSRLDPVTWKRAILTSLDIRVNPGMGPAVSYGNRWLDPKLSEFKPI